MKNEPGNVEIAIHERLGGVNHTSCRYQLMIEVSIPGKVRIFLLELVPILVFEQ